MKELSFLEGWGGEVIHAYKISLPFASGPPLQYHAERAGSYVDWVGLLEIDIVGPRMLGVVGWCW